MQDKRCGLRLILVIFVVWIMALSNNSHSAEKCRSESILTRDILNCISISNEIIDGLLNERYQAILSDRSFGEKDTLVAGERLWIRHRDSRCRDAFDSIYPGEEAEIERENCILSMNYSRVIELIYLASGVRDLSLDRFFAGVGGAERDQLHSIKRGLADRVVSIDGGKYFEKNCELALKLHEENISSCIERMKMQDL